METVFSGYRAREIRNLLVCSLLLAKLLFGVFPNDAKLSAQEDADRLVFNPDNAGYKTHAADLFSTYCIACHSGQTPEGDFAIDKGLEPNFANRSVAARWREVINVLNSHEMPPAGEPQPTPESVAELIDWATGEMIRVELHERKQHVTLRRLNPNEYRNTTAIS